MTDVDITWDSKVEKLLFKIPNYIRDKFYAWIFAVKRMGLSEVRKLSGYHDEPLKGSRQGNAQSA
jgi:proteic killer suppression protein